jgi:DNA-binding MarR family transcriptional regulator
LAGVPHYARERTLREAGVTAAEGGYARLAVGFDRPPESDAYALAGDVTAAFGSGEVTSLGRLGFDEIGAGPAALLEAADTTPTVAVRLGAAFRERRPEERERTLSLLATLGAVCRVAVLATGLSARWLAENHREQLPAEFSEQCFAPLNGGSPVADAVEAAREAFDADGRAVRILRDLAVEPGESLAYGALVAGHEVSRSRISQLLGTLEEADLVERYGPRTDQRVDLLPAGRAFVDTLDEETGRQQTLDAEFSEPGQSSYRDVLSRPHKSPPRDGPREEPPGEAAGAPYRTRYLDRAGHAAVGGVATDGAIVAAEASLPSVEDAEERHTRFVSYDADREEAVVAVRATTPLQYMVSVALGLASPRLLDAALPADRLAEIDDPPAILRDARCIGGLSAEAVEDPAVLRENLVEWGEDLEAMTTKLRREEYEDRDRFCGEILRSAHGLAGTVVHLLDAAGVDLVRELRVPSLSHGQMESLARTVSVATAIQSKYGAFATYRQLFEGREDKRRTALAPDVDAEDPVGEYIGSLVVRGPSAGRFGYHVEGQLSSPAPVHEDAPEFTVRLSVSTPGRSAYAEAATRSLSTKGLRSTREAVTLFRTLAGDPWAVTEAVRWLGSEEQARRIRLDEVRVGLAALADHDGPGRLLPDAPPSVSKAVGALLRSSRPLSQSALAETADVSTRSLRRHLDVLVALDLVRETGEGYRLALPFRDGERGEEIVPEALGDGLAARQDLVFDVVATLVDDASRFGDPDDVVHQAFIGFPPDFDALCRAFPALDPWVRVARDLCDEPVPEPSTVSFGPTPSQSPLGSSNTEPPSREVSG